MSKQTRRPKQMKTTTTNKNPKQTNKPKKKPPNKLNKTKQKPNQTKKKDQNCDAFQKMFIN